jgi:hypothetical protein
MPGIVTVTQISDNGGLIVILQLVPFFYNYYIHFV